MTIALESSGNRYYQTNKNLTTLALFHLWRTNPKWAPRLYEELVCKVSSEIQQGHAIDPSELISNFQSNHPGHDPGNSDRDPWEGFVHIVCRERSFWEHLMQHYQQEEGYDHFARNVFSTMQAYFPLDEELMIKACVKKPSCLRTMDPSLKRNRNFVREVLLGNPLALERVYSSAFPEPDLLGCMDGNLLAEVLMVDPVALKFVPHDQQRLEPNVVMDAFGQLGRRQQLNWNTAADIAHKIAPDLWQNRAMLLQWFRSGLPFTFSFHLMGSLADDQEVFLLIAEHCQQEHRRRSFQYASQALHANKEFMRKAIELDASLFGFASGALQQDFDLALLGFAAEDPAVVGAYLNEHHHPAQRHVVESFHRQVQGMLSVHGAFLTFLCCMSPRSGSTLTVLDQGSETSQDFKQLIAAFLDVPIGKKLHRLRRANSNLEESHLFLDEEDDGSENEDSAEEGMEDLERF